MSPDDIADLREAIERTARLAARTTGEDPVQLPAPVVEDGDLSDLTISEPLISHAEMAAELGVAYSTLSRWASGGLVPVYQAEPGGVRLYSRIEVLASLRSRNGGR